MSVSESKTQDPSSSIWNLLSPSNVYQSVTNNIGYFINVRDIAGAVKVAGYWMIFERYVADPATKIIKRGVEYVERGEREYSSDTEIYDRVQRKMEEQVELLKELKKLGVNRRPFIIQILKEETDENLTIQQRTLKEGILFGVRQKYEHKSRLI